VARWLQALVRRIWLMPQPATLEEHRRRYAAEIMRSTGAENARVEDAFATVPRENFLTPPPWRVFSPGGVIEKDTPDPADLYDDVLVVLDRRKGINNGQPSLHAAWISAVDPRAGETAIHIGIGAGYYTAILAKLVEAGGAVHAYEIDKPLAKLARKHLAVLPQVSVHAVSGVRAELPGADVIYVNAGATAPDVAWLRALKPGGRLIFPWQPMGGGGITLLVRRAEAGFEAVPNMPVGFISCIGAQAPPSGRCGPHDLMETQSVWLRPDREPDASATAIYDEVWFSAELV
jgi:protein-L-isoaspartate(D-aspartate) O-methyltransferase